MEITILQTLCQQHRYSFINDKFASTVCSKLHCNSEDALIQIEKLTSDFSKDLEDEDFDFDAKYGEYRTGGDINNVKLYIKER